MIKPELVYQIKELSKKNKDIPALKEKLKELRESLISEGLKEEDELVMLVDESIEGAENLRLYFNSTFGAPENAIHKAANLERQKRRKEYERERVHYGRC